MFRMKVATPILFCLLLCACLALSAPTLQAQTAGTGALTGVITDSSGGVVAGATVTVTSIARGDSRTATTAADGSYDIGILQPGDYKVHISATGFEALDVPSVTITVTQTAR